jgi:hypothetical protein
MSAFGANKVAQRRKRSRPARWLPRVVLGAIGGLGYYTFALRPRLLHWGASPDEADAPLPGDDLVPDAAYVTTRAVTVKAKAEAVWPWLVQLGQGRGGFYTYDLLEQMVGTDIRSADQILPDLQHLAVGDTIRLSPVGGPKVALLQPAGALVLFDTMDVRSGRSIAHEPPNWWAMYWTWSFILRPLPDGTTRLLVRTRANLRPPVLLALAGPFLLEPVHWLMERGMLLGIKHRTERAVVPAAPV